MVYKTIKFSDIYDTTFKAYFNYNISRRVANLLGKTWINAHIFY